MVMIMIPGAMQMKNEEEDVKPSPPPPAPGAPPPAPALAPLPHTVLVLQGKATLAGMSWEAKTVRASEATVHTAARTRGMRDRSKNAVFSVIVRGMGEVEDPGARTKEEARLRTALLKTRVPVFVLLQRGRLPALPLILEVTYDEARPRSAFGDLLASRLKMLGSQAPPPPPPPPPAPHRQPPPAASQHQQQHHAPLPTASRHDSVSRDTGRVYEAVAVWHTRSKGWCADISKMGLPPALCVCRSVVGRPPQDVDGPRSAEPERHVRRSAAAPAGLPKPGGPGQAQGQAARGKEGPPSQCRGGAYRVRHASPSQGRGRWYWW